MDSESGFTLIELLVVIAIVAVLAVTVILTLNPAELLRQARDSTRISDFSALKTALSTYIADTRTPAIGTSSNCYVGAGSGYSLWSCDVLFTAVGSIVTSTSQSIDGSGWIPVDFTSISSGSPLSKLPLDPINSGGQFYAYRPDPTNGTFELDADFESVKYSRSGSNDLESTDGGSRSGKYEVGTAPGLNL